MQLHALKTWPRYFAPVKLGLKSFEVRQDDRGFRVGDYLLLQEWNPDTQTFTGDEQLVQVVYCLRDPQFVREGMVVMGIIRVKAVS